MSNDEYITVVDEIFDIEESEQPFGKRWNNQLIKIKHEHLQALQQGKLLAIDDQGEYVIYLKLEGEKALPHPGPLPEGEGEGAKSTYSGTGTIQSPLPLGEG